MCGIFGYIGPRNGVKIALDGLKRIEYRGYDSAGMCAITENGAVCKKEVGKVKELEVALGDLSSNSIISHTRWATHGKVTRENAHPQFDSTQSVYVVMNGIIENYQALRESLEEEGVSFVSETDTEVLPHLIAKFYSGDLLKAVQEALLLVHGSYAMLVMHKDHSGELIAAANSAPLVIGVGKNETYIASDPNALIHHTREVIYLTDGEIAQIFTNRVEIYDESMVQISKETEELKHHVEEVSKGSFEHFTLKEIFEQPQTIRNAMLSRYFTDFGTVSFDELEGMSDVLHSMKRLLIIACGTSWHAGCIASYMLEDLARVPTQVEVSSEFRYKNPIVSDDTVVIAISQSGETADTLAAVREIRAKGAKVIGICNVQGSSLAREADATLFLRAGPEIGVCSTKAFTSMLVVLMLLTLLIGRQRIMSKVDGVHYLERMQEIPGLIEQVLDQKEAIEKIAKKYAGYTDFFYLGRRYMYPTCLEGALKLKEIAYVNANGYPAGEMKHGPIALINESHPTVAFVQDALTYEKMMSNLMEVKARHGKVIAIASKSAKGITKVCDDIIWVPETIDEYAPLVSSVAGQLFAYFVARFRGAEIDQPRNLAKSVTVE